MEVIMERAEARQRAGDRERQRKQRQERRLRMYQKLGKELRQK